MSMSDIVNLIVQNGMSVVIIGYFLFKDYKFNDQMVSILCEVKEVLASLKTYHEKEGE